MTDWEPQRYERFAAERRQPFVDLVAMCEPVPGGVVYDLGCGTGSRTQELPDALSAATVIGIDTSTTMLERTTTFADPRLSFREEDLRSFAADPRPDLVFSNAALHWVTDHPKVLRTWRSHLSPGGQLAVQLPVNADHPTQQLLLETAAEHSDWFPDRTPPELISTNSLAPERYAEILYQLGATHQSAMLRVYPHVLAGPREVVEWIQGTTLRPYRNALDPDRYRRFVEAYTHKLIAVYGEPAELLYTFKRILFWARF
jgi:trans-aconitate 2-methyltransferase